MKAYSLLPRYLETQRSLASPGPLRISVQALSAVLECEICRYCPQTPPLHPSAPARQVMTVNGCVCEWRGDVFAAADDTTTNARTVLSIAPTVNAVVLLVLCSDTIPPSTSSYERCCCRPHPYPFATNVPRLKPCHGSARRCTSSGHPGHGTRRTCPQPLPKAARPPSAAPGSRPQPLALHERVLAPPPQSPARVVPSGDRLGDRHMTGRGCSGTAPGPASSRQVLRRPSGRTPLRPAGAVEVLFVPYAESITDGARRVSSDRLLLAGWSLAHHRKLGAPRDAKTRPTFLDQGRYLPIATTTTANRAKTAPVTTAKTH